MVFAEGVEGALVMVEAVTEVVVEEEGEMVDAVNAEKKFV